MTSGAALAADRGQLFPSEATRYADPATEFEVHRLTDPAHASWLPSPCGRFLSQRGHFLIYASERTGAAQGYRMDLRSGQSRAITNLTALVPESLTMLPDEKSVCCVAGRSIHEISLGSLRSREVYESPAGWDPSGAFSLSDDGLYGALVERSRDRGRLRVVAIRSGAATTVAESSEAMADPQPRPRRAGLLYRRGGGELWLVNFDGAQNRRLHPAAGDAGPALWSPDGRTVLYLNFPEDRKKLNSLRELTPDANEDRPIASTSQFVQFGRNADASVIVGASGSKASPYVLLLVRSVRRELTLCEHRASNPARVNPVFSPDSQRVFFQSDRHGRMAIYSIHVERLVSETDVG